MCLISRWPRNWQKQKAYKSRRLSLMMMWRLKIAHLQRADGELLELYFVQKVAGAKAEQGGTLEEIKAIADKTVAQVHSMGMAISPCTIPAAGKPSFQLGEDEMEIGKIGRASCRERV